MPSENMEGEVKGVCLSRSNDPISKEENNTASQGSPSP